MLPTKKVAFIGLYKKEKQMKYKIYLADLFDDFLGAKQFVPINIGYTGSYCAEKFGDDVSVELF